MDGDATVGLGPPCHRAANAHAVGSRLLHAATLNLARVSHKPTMNILSHAELTNLGQHVADRFCLSRVALVHVDVVVGVNDESPNPHAFNCRPRTRDD